MNVVAQQLLQRHGLTAVIGALVIGLLAAIGYETGWGSGLRPTPALARSEAAKTADTSLLPTFGLPAIDVAFKETVERPLFLPTRRPVPVATGSTAPAMVKGRFRLAGTVLNQDLPFAFLVAMLGLYLRVHLGRPPEAEEEATLEVLKHVILVGSGAPGNAATRLEQYAVTGGLYAYGSYPEVDGLFKAQAVEVNPRARRQIVEKMQQIIHERVMFAPILEYAYLVSIGPRVEYDAINAIPANPYTAPYEDLRLKKR